MSHCRANHDLFFSESPFNGYVSTWPPYMLTTSVFVCLSWPGWAGPSRQTKGPVGCWLLSSPHGLLASGAVTGNGIFHPKKGSEQRLRAPLAKSRCCVSCSHRAFGSTGLSVHMVGFKESDNLPRGHELNPKLRDVIFTSSNRSPCLMLIGPKKVSIVDLLVDGGIDNQSWPFVE